MLAADVPVAERISDDAFFELDQHTYPRDWPAPERRTPEHSATWISRTLRFLEHDRRRVLGRRGRVRRRRLCDVVRARAGLVPGDVRRPPAAPGRRRRPPGAGGSGVVRRALHRWAVVGVGRPAGHPALLEGGVRAAPADVPAGHGRPAAARDDQRRERRPARRPRDDGRDRPGPPRRWARHRSRSAGRDGPPARGRDGDRERVRLHRWRPARRTGGDRRGHRSIAALGVPGRCPRGVPSCRT